MVEISSLSKKKAFLFDYGDTLVKYYKGNEFYPILKKALQISSNYLKEKKISIDDIETLWKRALKENFENEDYSVRPLSGRLQRIFQLKNLNDQSVLKLQRNFMKVIFSVAHIFEDSIPTLKILKQKIETKIIIVSNTPWGSPSELWNTELIRFNLDNSMDYIDQTVFCVDVGWRKPAPPIFKHVLDSFQLRPQECIFIGDNPKWDVLGPQKMNIEAILLDRDQKYKKSLVPKIHSLHELLQFI